MPHIITTDDEDDDDTSDDEIEDARVRVRNIPTHQPAADVLLAQIDAQALVVRRAKAADPSGGHTFADMQTAVQKYLELEQQYIQLTGKQPREISKVEHPQPADVPLPKIDMCLFCLSTTPVHESFCMPGVYGTPALIKRPAVERSKLKPRSCKEACCSSLTAGEHRVHAFKCTHFAGANLGDAAPELIERLKGTLGYPTATRVKCESVQVMRDFRAACIEASKLNENALLLPAYQMSSNGSKKYKDHRYKKTAVLKALYFAMRAAHPWVPEVRGRIREKSPTKRDYIDMLEKLRVLTSAISVQYSVKIEKVDDMKADHNGGVIKGHVSYPNNQTFPMVVVFHAMFINGHEHNMAAFTGTTPYSVLSLCVDNIPAMFERKGFAQPFDFDVSSRFFHLGLPKRTDAVKDMFLMHTDSGIIRTIVFWLKQHPGNDSFDSRVGIDDRLTDMKCTQLVRAAIHDDYEKAKALIDLGADPNIPDKVSNKCVRKVHFSRPN
jgi:hypothetical protein